MVPGNETLSHSTSIFFIEINLCGNCPIDCLIVWKNCPISKTLDSICIGISIDSRNTVSVICISVFHHLLTCSLNISLLLLPLLLPLVVLPFPVLIPLLVIILLSSSPFTSLAYAVTLDFTFEIYKTSFGNVDWYH